MEKQIVGAMTYYPKMETVFYKNTTACESNEQSYVHIHYFQQDENTCLCKKVTIMK